MTFIYSGLQYFLKLPSSLHSNKGIHLSINTCGGGDGVCWAGDGGGGVEEIGLNREKIEKNSGEIGGRVVCVCVCRKRKKINNFLYVLHHYQNLFRRKNDNFFKQVFVNTTFIFYVNLMFVYTKK